jgi:hypothetical protein
MECFEQSNKRDLTGVETALNNGVQIGLITPSEYRMFLITLEKKYGKMLSRSDKGKKRK